MTANVNSGDTYVITNVKAGTAIDLSVGDNRTVTGWPVHGGDNQRWTMEQTESGWTFRNVYTGGYLSIDGSPSDGTPIVATSSAFEWYIFRDQTDQNTFRIFVPQTQENLDLWADGLATPGDPITLWGQWNGLHQTWKFNQVS